MKLVPLSELVYAEPRPETPEGRKEKQTRILAVLNAPIDLGALQKVAYDPKSDRYAVTFAPGKEKALTLKASNEVAAFLAEHATASGYWRGRIEDGALVDVYLIQA